MDRNVEERAAHYSFNIESVLFNQLPKELQTVWKQEIEQAYRAGAQEEIENPTSGQLLRVYVNGSKNGRNEAINDVQKVLKCVTIDGRYGDFVVDLMQTIETIRQENLNKARGRVEIILVGN